MTRDDMQRFAEEWIAAWNRRDLDAVLAPFADDARFTSPRAVAILGTATATDKATLRRYWQAALDRHHTLVFTLYRVLCDVERREMVVVYERNLNGEKGRACELMRFDEAGRQIEGEAMYGALV